MADYERLVEEFVAALHPGNYALAVELASLPDHIRGYGHIRKRHAEHAKRREARLLEEFRGRGRLQDEAGERATDAPVVMAG